MRWVSFCAFDGGCIVSEERAFGASWRLAPTGRVRRLPTQSTTTKVVAVEILPSARKHGISDDDIRHGFNTAVAAITTPDQPDFTMVVGRT